MQTKIFTNFYDAVRPCYGEMPKGQIAGIVYLERDFWQSIAGVSPGGGDEVNAVAKAYDAEGTCVHIERSGGHVGGNAIIMQGGNPLEELKKATESLPNKTPVSILMRGDVGTAMQTLSPEAIEHGYKTMVEAAGDHPLMVRMFTAQNNLGSMEHSIKTIHKLRAAGKKIDLSIECSYKENMDIEKDIVPFMVEAAMVSSGTIGVKDYSGVLKPGRAVEIYQKVNAALDKKAGELLAQANELAAKGKEEEAKLYRAMVERLGTTRIEFHCHATQKTLNRDEDGNILGQSTYEAVVRASASIGRKVVVHTVPNVANPSHGPLGKDLMDAMDAANGNKIDRQAAYQADEAMKKVIELNQAVMIPTNGKIPEGNGTAGGGTLQKIQFAKQITAAINERRKSTGENPMSEEEGLTLYSTELVKWMNETFVTWQGVTPMFSVAMRLVYKREMAKIEGKNPDKIDITEMEMEGIRSINPKSDMSEEGREFLQYAYRLNLKRSPKGSDAQREGTWHEGRVQAVDTLAPAKARVELLHKNGHLAKFLDGCKGKVVQKRLDQAITMIAWWGEAGEAAARFPDEYILPKDAPNKEEWDKSIAATKARIMAQMNTKGSDAAPDLLDKTFDLRATGRITSGKSDAIIAAVRGKEESELKAWVAKYVAGKAEEKMAYKDLVEGICSKQTALINDPNSNDGRSFLLPSQERIKIVLDTLNNFIISGNKEKSRAEMSEIKREMDSKSVRAPMPARIVALRVEEGEVVAEGQVIAVIEAMKMQMNVTAKAAGRVGKFEVAPGGMVANEQLFVSIEPEKSEAVESDGQSVQFDTEKVRKQTKASEQAATEWQESLNLCEIVVKDAQNKDVVAPNLTQIENQGYNSGTVVPELNQKMLSNPAHLVFNRGTYVSELNRAIDACGGELHILHTRGDRTTFPVQNADSDKLIEICSYTPESTFPKIIEFAKAHPEGAIVHLGYGFISENPKALKELAGVIEQEGLNLTIAAPNHEVVASVGSKLGFRKKLIGTALDTPHFGNATSVDIEDLEDYLKSSSPAPGDLRKHIKKTIIEKEYKKAKNIGDVMIKANAGGGGKGIRTWKFNRELTEEQNREAYTETVLAVRKEAAAEKAWNDDSCLTEKRLRGFLKHIEVQLAFNGEGGAMILGYRNCTLQAQGQKVYETNLIKGDLPQEIIDYIEKHVLEFADGLAKDGNYKGLGTFELGVNWGKGDVLGGADDIAARVTPFEINTRPQVEHPVSEHDALAKTGKAYSMLAFNAALAADKTGATPQEIFLNLHPKWNDADIEKLPELGTQRVVHARITARDFNVTPGEAGSKPAPVNDSYWVPGHANSVAKEHKVDVMVGGGGKGGTLDSLIAVVAGKRDGVVAAIKSIFSSIKRSASLKRDHGAHTSCNFISAFDQVMFEKDGTFNPDITIDTAGKVSEAINAGEADIRGEKGGIDSDKLRDLVANLAERIREQAKTTEKPAAQKFRDLVQRNTASGYVIG